MRKFLQSKTPINWSGIYRSLSDQYGVIQFLTDEFLDQNKNVNGRKMLRNYPPRVELCFWITATDNRRKTVQVNISVDPKQSKYVSVAFPTQSEFDTVANFVGLELATKFHLKPRRINRKSDLLEYELKPSYLST